MGLLDAFKDKQFRDDVADNGMNFLRSASNAAAGNVTGPVDMLAWALRKAGVPVGDAPLGGSQWAKNAGLLNDVQHNSPSSLAGETMGLLAPIAMTAGAPKIAGGLLKVADNAAVPQNLNRQAGMIVYHGSNTPPKSLTEINSGGVFGGIFASPSRSSAESHIIGDKGSLYRMTIPDDQVMTHADDLPYETAIAVAKNNIRKGSPHIEEIADMALYNKSAFDANIPEDDLLHAMHASDLGDADWAIQKLRGQMAKAGGFKAVSMPDEHGLSYLVLPGTRPRPVLK